MKAQIKLSDAKIRHRRTVIVCMLQLFSVGSFWRFLYAFVAVSETHLFPLSQVQC